MNTTWSGSTELVAAQDKIIAQLKAENATLKKEVEHQRHNAVMRYKQWRELTDAFLEDDGTTEWVVVANQTGAEFYASESQAIGAANRNAEEGQKSAVVRLMSVVDIPHHAMTKDDEIMYQEEWK